MLYGALTKAMDLAGLLVPYPVPPFPGISFGEMCSKLHGMKSPVWHYNGNKRAHQHPCNLKISVTEIVDKAIEEARGLELKNSILDG
jgi:hypothetical protein